MPGVTRRNSFINYEAIWKSDEESQNCDRCNEKFTFLSRRHHCRCCGNIFCKKCTANFALYDTQRVKIVKNPDSSWEYPPYRTCDSCFQMLRGQGLISSKYCYEEIQGGEQEQAQEGSTEEEQESGYCPICNLDLTTFPTEQLRESHVIECINVAEQNQQHLRALRDGDIAEESEEEREGSLRCPTLQNRMLVYTIPAVTTAQKEFQECPICFEEMRPGEKIGRLECLCMYHYDCIRSWFKKKRKSGEHRNFCPIHDAIS